MKISASILSVKDDLEKIKEINDLDIDYIHLDIMDGIFVPNKSFTYQDVLKIQEYTNKKFDVHLMVDDIKSNIYNYAMLNTDMITFHYEAMKDTDVISIVKSYGLKVGISIKPDTSIDQIYDLLPYIDLVLIMSVEPGKGGQEFIPNSLDKIQKLKEKIQKDNLNVIISVDGGINNNSAKLCKASGADMLVIGTALFKENNKKEFIDSVK